MLLTTVVRTEYQLSVFSLFNEVDIVSHESLMEKKEHLLQHLRLYSLTNALVEFLFRFADFLDQAYTPPKKRQQHQQVRQALDATTTSTTTTTSSSFYFREQ